MFGGLISWLMENMLYFALHMESGTVFPKPLSAQQEAEAFRRMAEGDTSARSELIVHNLRLVAHVVKKYYTSNADTAVSSSSERISAFMCFILGIIFPPHYGIS